MANRVDSHIGINVPQARRPSMGPSFMPTGGPAASSASTLPFMSFNLGSVPTSFPPPPPPLGAYRSSTGLGIFEEEPPLLEELGINTSLILRKTRSVLNPIKVNPDLHEDPDLSGPFLFCLLFGLFQLLSGKIHFGVILGWISVASLFLYVVFNLLAGKDGNLDLYRCLSVVGYSLLPIVIFSALSLFIPRTGLSTYAIACLTVVWCTRACTSLLVVLAPHADEHRSLVAYACFLIYATFSLLVLF